MPRIFSGATNGAFPLLNTMATSSWWNMACAVLSAVWLSVSVFFNRRAGRLTNRVPLVRAQLLPGVAAVDGDVPSALNQSGPDVLHGGLETPVLRGDPAGSHQGDLMGGTCGCGGGW